MIGNLAGSDLVCQQAVPMKLERLRAQPTGADLPPLEQLLVDRLVSCWLSLHEAELRSSQGQDFSIEQSL